MKDVLLPFTLPGMVKANVRTVKRTIKLSKRMQANHRARLERKEGKGNGNRV